MVPLGELLGGPWHLEQAWQVTAWTGPAGALPQQGPCLARPCSAMAGQNHHHQQLHLICMFAGGSICPCWPQLDAVTAVPSLVSTNQACTSVAAFRQHGHTRGVIYLDGHCDYTLGYHSGRWLGPAARLGPRRSLSCNLLLGHGRLHAEPWRQLGPCCCWLALALLLLLGLQQ